jgi:hypothetical protein
MRFRKKPVEIEAVQWDGDAFVGAVPEWLARAFLKPNPWASGFVPGSGAVWRMGDDLHVDTLEGLMTARPGDWIIRGVAGELYPCKPAIFAATYEAVA